MLTTDRTLYLVIVGHKSGDYTPEQDVSDMNRETVIRDIAGGQYDDLRQVIAFNPFERICDDVTDDICDEVCEVWARRGDPLSRWQYDFVEMTRGIVGARAFARAA
jgi:hypothetical protein